MRRPAVQLYVTVVKADPESLKAGLTVSQCLTTVNQRVNKLQLLVKIMLFLQQNHDFAYSLLFPQNDQLHKRRPSHSAKPQNMIKPMSALS